MYIHTPWINFILLILGGILLGLGLVKERIGQPLEAISILKQSLGVFKKQFKSKKKLLIKK